MTTVSNYEPTLTYEPSFERSEKSITQKLTVPGTTPGDKGKSQYIRMCVGSSVEELLYTYRLFENASADLGISDATKIKQWLTVLGPGPRSKWNNMIANRGASFASTNWSGSKKEFIQIFAEDTQAKDTVLDAFGDNKTFAKPVETSVRDHYERIDELCDYTDLLPGSRTAKLTKEERRNIFYNTFPKTWRDDYKRSGNDIMVATIQNVKDYMSFKKREADKEHNKKKKESERKKNENNRNGGRGRGGRGRSYGPDSACRLHPGSNHTWRECSLNPRNQNKPYGNRGRGFGGRGFGGRGRGQQGRGYGGRSYFNNNSNNTQGSNRDQYFQNDQQSQSSTIATNDRTVGFDSYANQAYDNQSPREWGGYKPYWN